MHLLLLRNKRKLGLFNFYLFLIFTVLPIGLNAQQKVDSTNSAWSQVKLQLENQSADTSYHFIHTIVRDICEDDFDCLYNQYLFLRHKLEQDFNLPAAIYLGEEMVRIAHLYDKKEEEASAHLSQHRFYNAISNDQLAAIHLDKAATLYEQLEDHHHISIVNRFKLLDSMKYRDLIDILKDMQKQLAIDVSSGDTINITHMYIAIIQLAINAEQYKVAKKSIKELDHLIANKSNSHNSYWMLIRATLLKANMAQALNKPDEAVIFYKQALNLAIEEPDRWHEINALLSLARLEWDRKNAIKAESYLGEGLVKAKSLNMNGLLIEIYKLKAEIEEHEGNYADALRSLREELENREILESRNAGFDLQRYNLQMEKEKLLAEDANKALQLRMKKIELRNTMVIMILVILLAAGLLIGLYKQRKGKKELFSQNSLIKEQSDQLKNLDEAKSRFFANVSHELRTPLTLLIGPVETLLKENQLTQRQVQLLNLANQNGKHLQQLVNEILDLRKLEMGKLKLTKEATDLNIYFHRYLAQFESLAHRKQIDYDYDLSIDNRFIADIDTEKYRQVIYNLISNAFKFTPPEGQIKVSISFIDGVLHMDVADSGAGIHPIDLPHVFDRFYQTSRPNVPAAGGTGIGLALCKEYAGLFSGELTVDSELGNGSVFRFSFPIEQLEPGQLEGDIGEIIENDLLFDDIKADHSQENINGAKPTIMVVEDNLVLQQYMGLLLEDDYNIIAKENGQLALDHLSENPDCQLILSDLMMPVMDGYQLLENLKTSEATQHIPAIMLTARAEVSDKLHALRIGVDDYLTKPFNEEELKVRIKNLLKTQHVRNSVQQENKEKTLDSKPVISQPDKEWIESFERFVQDHVADDTLCISMLTEEFAMSESTLLRQVKRLIGLSPNQYIKEVRLDQARRFLEERQYNSVKTIAIKVGYSDVRTFSRSFRKRYGKSPSEFLEKQVA